MVTDTEQWKIQGGPPQDNSEQKRDKNVMASVHRATTRVRNWPSHKAG